MSRGRLLLVRLLFSLVALAVLYLFLLAYVRELLATPPDQAAVEVRAVALR